MNCLSLYFVRPGYVEVREEAIPEPAPFQVIVRTLYSAISSGTELLIYRQQTSADQPADISIKALAGNFQYPLKYGYSAVGQVIELGPEVDASWKGKTVFVFHPHVSHFTVSLNELIPVPEGISPEDALFLSNMESAVNLIMDGQPVIGEKVVVFGQGIVGLLTTALLSRFPLEKIVTLDLYPLRRRLSEQLGAQHSFDPGPGKDIAQVKSLLTDEHSAGADLTYELSGNPESLNTAIEVTGFNGRVIVGSWYGTQPINLTLDNAFHRSRIRLLASQVSTIAPMFQGRWNKPRRFQTAWQMINSIRPSQFISRRIPLTHAPEAYQALDKNPDEVVQIIFTYPR
jgi:2-desacetyl-2-hydroxyethyl bacteriochlorophyllide A dehydrogenase